jgi:Skp family chaperone for outer membrane proteins
MKSNLLTATLITAILVAPATSLGATDADIVELRRALQQVNQRLDALEQQNQSLKTQNDQLAAKNQELETKSKAIEETNDRQTDALAQASARAKSAEWASRIAFKGDFRYRHENVDPEEAVNDQTRQRIRARFGLTAKINDTISATLQLATNAAPTGNNDPRSTNQTLGSGWDRKGIAVDLAYLDWAPANGLNVQLGKMPYPFQRVGTYFWDPDLTPEGGAVKYAHGAFFGSAFGYWLSENATMSDSNVFGAQFGMKGDVGPVKLTGALMYYDLGAVQNEVVSIIAPSVAAPAICPAGQVNNTFFANNANGNTTRNFGDNCARLVNDFEIYEILGQAEFGLGKIPLVVFANYGENTAADDLNNAWAAGFTIGRAGNPRTWEFGYAYQKTEKDALFGQFVDSDFGGGLTDVDGSVFKFVYAPAKNWTLNGTYFLNQRFIDVPTTVGGVPRTSLDYDRYQIDFNVKF